MGALPKPPTARSSGMVHVLSLPIMPPLGWWSRALQGPKDPTIRYIVELSSGVVSTFSAELQNASSVDPDRDRDNAQAEKNFLAMQNILSSPLNETDRNP